MALLLHENQHQKILGGTVRAEEMHCDQKLSPGNICALRSVPENTQ